MKVTLYKFTGDSDTANKLLRNCTVIYDREVVPYGAFNPNGASFRLDVLYDVNYAKFTYNGHDYYGYVYVSTDSKGLYNYSISTDPLTTAWYAGCFNSSNKVLYSDYGDNLLFDNRAKYKDGINILNININPLRKEYYIILVVRHLSPETDNTQTLITNAVVYLFETCGDFSRFAGLLYSLSPEDQKKYIPSIISLYCVPKNTINLDQYTAPQNSPVNLMAMLGNEKFSGGSYYKPINGDNLDYYHARILKAVNNYTDLSKEISSQISYPLTSYRQKSVFHLHIMDMGNISFKYSDVSKNQDITSIGYRISYDFSTGTQMVYLTINNTVLKNYCLKAPIPITFPINYVSSIQRLDQLIVGTFSNAMNFVSNIATLNPAGAYNAGSKIISDVLNYNFEKDYGAQSTIGTIGGSVETNTAYGSYLTILEYAPHNLTDIQNKFGKPDGLVRVIGNLTGWIQTETCHLPSQGLPFNIVNKAEQLSDIGFRIVN